MRCVAFGCNKTHKEGVSFHTFPSDENLRRKWTLAVQKTRANWNPSKHSTLCSDHFEPECYEAMSQLGCSIGVTGKINKRLKKNMMPTIFIKPKYPGTTGERQPKERCSNAYEKREHRRILQSISTTESTTTSEEICLQQEGDIPLPFIEPPTSDKETQISEPVHCACCISSSATHKIRLKNSSFQWDGRPKMFDKGMQIFPVLDEVQSSQPVSDELKSKTTNVTPVCELEAESEEDSDDDENHDDDQQDPDYVPCYDEDDDEEECEINDGHVDGDTYKGRKFVVFEEQLLSAFGTCPICGHPSTSNISAVIGTFCRVQQTCHNCEFVRVWDSQPFIKDVPAGNILLSAAILLSGCAITKSLRLFRHLRLKAITSQTFFKHQQMYLLPSIRHVWQHHQKSAITHLRKDASIVLGGDGRADSPGHSAKYGSYTLMDLKVNRIVDVQIVQSNEVGSSYHMEKEGLIRAINYLLENNISISTLVTDRHSQIKKWVRENLPDTKHKFDLWHIAKGISKKLEAVAKLASGSAVKPWIHSISNHLYWCATSTEDGNGEVMLAKWKSVGRHIQDIHTGHGDVFPECAHGTLEGKERKKKWMATGSVAVLKTLAIVNNTRLCKDIPMMSEKYQTSKLEAFHSTLNHFAPKMTHFSFWGQTCRTILAALHYNENANREQAVTAEGKEKYRVAFPKFKKGGYIVRAVYKEPTYDYVDEILNFVVDFCNGDKRQPLLEAPAPLCSNFSHPDKDEAVAEHCSRFSLYCLLCR